MQNPPTGKKRTAVTYAGNAARRASFGGLDFEYLPFASENFFFDSNIALVDLVKDQRGVWLQEKYLTASRKGGLEPSRVMRAPAAPMRSIEPR
jgi:hypothetical protein